jgi:hypothetical protein
MIFGKPVATFPDQASRAHRCSKRSTLRQTHRADKHIGVDPPHGKLRYFVELWLVESFAGGMLQPFDLILDHQLAALQLDNSQVVGGKVHECIVQFILKALVLTFKFNKMRL